MFLSELDNMSQLIDRPLSQQKYYLMKTQILKPILFGLLIAKTISSQASEFAPLPIITVAGIDIKGIKKTVHCCRIYLSTNFAESMSTMSPTARTQNKPPQKMDLTWPLATANPAWKTSEKSPDPIK